ncbi:MAG TPA: CBS domain-containing protein [Candidatus Nanoarchaeia archaeon]|nr:CBS domain-containing protein [Candidatus Nanoarchaeia archaeon]
MTIDKVPMHRVLTCSADDSVSHVAQVLKKNKDRRVFVVDKQKRLQGIITTTDLTYKAIATGKTGLKAKQVMTKNVASIDVKDDIGKALHIMNKLKSFVCPITDKGKIVGIVSYHDLVRYLCSTVKQE